MIDQSRTRRVLAGLAVILFMVSAPLVAAACGDSESGGDAAIAYIDVTEADNESTIPAEVYDIITVSLAENQTTGYTWEATISPGFEMISSEYVADETSTEAPVDGGGGQRVWKLRVAKAGEWRFTATLYPPDREIGPDAERFTFEVAAE